MSKQLPILFARGNNGQILEWQVEVQGNKYRTITGTQGCQHVISDWTMVSEGKNLGKKNATTIEEQAFSEAESRWEKKVKHGGYWEDIADIDKSKFVEPMLANHYKDRIGKVAFPVLVDRKYNGMRQVTHKQGQFSRKGESIISAPHIFERIKHLFNKHPNLVLDGELYNHEYRFKLSEFIKIVNKTKHFTDKDLKLSAEVVDYYVYDGYGFTVGDEEITEDTPCSGRRMALRQLLGGIEDVVVVDYEMAFNHEEVMETFQRFLDDGYEGAIVRLDTKYEHRRTNALLKVKSEDDDEAIILDILEGDGNWSGAAAKAKMSWSGNIFDATFKGEYEPRVQILKNKKDWIGKTATFLHIGYTGKAVEGAPKGLPFSPRIDPSNCFKGDR